MKGPGPHLSAVGRTRGSVAARVPLCHPEEAKRSRDLAREWIERFPDKSLASFKWYHTNAPRRRVGREFLPPMLMGSERTELALDIGERAKHERPSVT